MGVGFQRCPAVLAFAFVCLVSQAYIAKQKIISDTESCYSILQTASARQAVCPY
jgi:hypothetical protein